MRDLRRTGLLHGEPLLHVVVELFQRMLIEEEGSVAIRTDQRDLRVRAEELFEASVFGTGRALR